MNTVLGLIALATNLAVASGAATLAVASGQDSTVLAISAKPSTARVGTPVTLTAAGSGLCGAVHIDWGDGTAITYPTERLPVAQSHTYKHGGSYTIRAQGMGNCVGQATTKLQVSGPPPPPPAPPAAAPTDSKPAPATIGGVDVSTPADAGAGMRSIRVSGTGTCAYTLDFGDGNTEGRNAALPDVTRHNYPARGRYTIVATAAPPCTGSARATAVVGGPADPGRMTAIDVVAEGRTGEPIVVIVRGSGYCTITVDFDDERQREITARLPARVSHTFDRAGRFEIVAWAHAPCAGGASADVRVR